MSCVVIVYDHILHGGLGDVIVGLVSALCLSTFLNRRLIIKWDKPDINGVFDLGNHNFYKSPITLDRNIITLDTIDNRFKYESLLSSQNLLGLWTGRNLLLRCNQDIGVFLYKNPHFSTNNRNYNTDMLNYYQQIFTVILKPNPVIFEYKLNIPKPYIGIQLRTGDAYMGVGDHQPVKDVNFVVSKLARWVQAQQQYKSVYLTTDNSTVKSLLQAQLPNHAVFDIPASRFHSERSSSTTNKMQNLISDLMFLMSADLLVISAYSNFGRIAALMSKTNKPIMGFYPPIFDVITLSKPSLFSKHESNLKVNNIITKPSARGIYSLRTSKVIRPKINIMRGLPNPRQTRATTLNIRSRQQSLLKRTFINQKQNQNPRFVRGMKRNINKIINRPTRIIKTTRPTRLKKIFNLTRFSQSKKINL